MAGFDIYVFKSRADAANLAAQVSRVQKEVKGENAGFLSVSWAKLKSGITRQVKIPASNSKAEMSAMKPVVSNLQELKDKELCTRKASPFDVPEGFSWSHGNAKRMSRHIVVRHWTTPGKIDSSMHTALSMKDKIADIDEYATWTPRKIRLINWSRSKNPFKRFLAPIKMKLDDLLTQDFPIAPPSYRDDKALYLGDRTKFRLQAGVDARQSIAEKEAVNPLIDRHIEVTVPETVLPQADGGQDEITDNTVKTANYKPLPFQKTSSKDNREWQRRAEKHYLPCVGFDKDQWTGRETFTMFGLDLEKMRNKWIAVKNPEHPNHYYKQFSTEQNCSGMCLSLLKEGGAGLFYNFSPSLVTTQSDVEKYSAKLVDKLDRLNKHVDDLDEKIRLYKVPNEPELPLSSIPEKLVFLLSTYSMDESWKAKIQEVASIIHEIENAPSTLKGLTPIAIRLTTSLDRLFKITSDNPYLTDRLEPALHAFKILKNRMEDAYREQVEMFEDPYFE
ncbi:hypothetical protein GZ77_24400 [Endozoicomonas montiporae]|uniref:Uncharacterized protein n=2 Tax=Endozoicomonas montiporae TaxID=1027273 RepID=A0A081MZN7_9GAMM|nr:hypothetical protein [Endozoicomonas montiporae]AMO54652.1 sicP binding family protein [Endozoicomonas montiporae CL-33]KEQ11660.1 hypothetical protein GZ77_24400 [Endozoicomonas montiporae]